MQKINYFIIFKLIIIQTFLFPFSKEDCFLNCKTCYDSSKDYKDMKCSSCPDDRFFIFNTSNCEEKKANPNYYLNQTDLILYPCSLFPESHCYECNPYLNDTKGICLSCEPGYFYYSSKHECKKCNTSKFPIIYNGFERCESYYDGFCDRYTTYCRDLESEEIICPEDAPFYNTINKSCHEFECQKFGLENGVCTIENKKYKNRILFINWLDSDPPKYCRYPSYNTDNSGYLLIEIGCQSTYAPSSFYIEKTSKRKLYFYNEKGRGIFDEINDIYKKEINYDKKFTRQFSTSLLLKLNNSEEKRYVLSLENAENNLEFFDIKTGEYSTDDIFDVFDIAGRTKVQVSYLPNIILFEANEKNQFFISFYIYEVNNEFNSELSLMRIRGYLNQEKREKINIYSLAFIDYKILQVMIWIKMLLFILFKQKKEISYIFIFQ